MSARCTLINVSKRYGSRWALQHVTLTTAPGEIVGLIGANGAGKTTLLRIAARLVRQHAGTVDAPSEPNGETRYFAGERTLPPDVRVKRWRRLWTLEPDPTAGRKRIGALSRGMRQKLGLETVLARPQRDVVVLLDEPWEGLDPDASRWLSTQLREVRATGAAALVSSHRIHDLAAICDRCVFVSQGRVVRQVDFGACFVPNRSAFLLEVFEQSKRACAS